MKSIDSIAAACYAFIIQLMEMEDLVFAVFPNFPGVIINKFAFV